MTNQKVGYFVGSLAKNSINRTLSKALINGAPPHMEFTEIPIRDLPLYSNDYDDDYPPEARALKETIAPMDAILFVTPEYNRSIPVDSRTPSTRRADPGGSFARKPSAVIGTSPGAIGTAVAQQSLNSVMRFCNSPLMNAVEAYIQFKPGLFTESGAITDSETEGFLRNYMQGFHEFIARVMRALQAHEL